MCIFTGIAYLMGEPIKNGNPNIGDNVNNFCTGTEAQLQVNIVLFFHNNNNIINTIFPPTREDSPPGCNPLT